MASTMMSNISVLLVAPAAPPTANIRLDAAVLMQINCRSSGMHLRSNEVPSAA